MHDIIYCGCCKELTGHIDEVCMACGTKNDPDASPCDTCEDEKCEECMWYA